uniref:Uncharacterized protein n=1 Tax=Parascaris equorum TaxID=6256 RepID=A0A914RNM3_PAREQ
MSIERRISISPPQSFPSVLDSLSESHILVGSVAEYISEIDESTIGVICSFFQSLCVLGYCLLPPATATSMLFALRLLVTGIGFIWATYASMAFLS